MIGSILTGLLTAVIVFLPRYLYLRFSGLAWSSPVLILGVGAVAILLQKYFMDRRAWRSNYSGLSDLLLHVHSSLGSNSVFNWVIQGVVSFLLTCFGSVAGPEGGLPNLHWP